MYDGGHGAHPYILRTTVLSDRFKKRVMDCARGCCVGRVGVQNCVAHCCAVQMTEFFTGEVRYENNYRLVTPLTLVDQIYSFLRRSRLCKVTGGTPDKLIHTGSLQHSTE